MFMSEIIKIYSPKAEVISLTTTEEIEWLLSRELKLKKSDFSPEEWEKIIKHCSRSIRNYTRYSQIGSLIKNEIVKMALEGDLLIGTGHR